MAILQMKYIVAEIKNKRDRIRQQKRHSKEHVRTLEDQSSSPKRKKGSAEKQKRDNGKQTQKWQYTDNPEKKEKEK